MLKKLFNKSFFERFGKDFRSDEIQRYKNKTIRISGILDKIAARKVIFKIASSRCLSFLKIVSRFSRSQEWLDTRSLESLLPNFYHARTQGLRNRDPRCIMHAREAKTVVGAV